MNAENGRNPEAVTVRPAELAKTRPRDWLIRFGFGAAVSALARAVSAVAGPRSVGCFWRSRRFCWPASPSSRRRKATAKVRDDASGATFGTLGLLAFAVTAAVLAARTPMWLALSAAGAAWLAVAPATYFTTRHPSTTGRDDRWRSTDSRR